MENYTAKDITAILETISWDPASFRRLCAAKKISVTDHEIVRSMYAWGIDPTATQGPTNYRPSRKR